MPPVVAAIAVAIANAVFEGSVIAAEIIYAVGTIIELAVVNLLVSKITQALAGKPANQGLVGPPASREITARGTIEFRQLIYGQVRTGGYLAFFGTSGANNNFLWFVIVAAGHECQAIDDLWLDARHVANADIGGGGAVTSATFSNAGTSRLSVWKYLGGSSQAVDSNLNGAFPEWDATHVGKGVAYTVFRLDRDDQIWQTGAPTSFYQLVKGRKLYDPRLDSTNGGSGSHRVTDPSTWAWSNNWALAVRDYISGGSITYSAGTPEKRLTIGEADARIDDAYIIAAANHADEVVSVPLPVLPGTTNWGNSSSFVTGNGTLFRTYLAAGYTLVAPNGANVTISGTPASDTSLTLTTPYGGTSVVNQTTHYGASTTATELRFTADVQLTCGATHQENLTALLSAGNGHLSYVSGKYRLYAGVYDSPAVTLTQDDVLGAVDVLTHDPADQVWNYVTGTFFDENNNWTQASFPAQQNTTYETDDGRQYPKSIQLPATRGNYRAQRLAQVILQQGRNMLSVKFSALSPNAMQIAEWETFQVTIPEYGWVNQVFRCITWSFLASGLIEITARSEGSSAYADLAVGSYVDPATNNPPGYALAPPDPPLGLTTTSDYNSVVVVVTPPAYFPSGSVIEIWEYSSNSPFSSATNLMSGRATTFRVPHGDTTTRYYWATVRDITGARSTNYPSGAGTAGVAIPLTTGQIAPNSATDIGQNIVNLTASTFGLGSISINDIAFTAAATGTVEVTATLDCKTAVGFDAGQYFVVYIDPAWAGTGFISGSATFGNQVSAPTSRVTVTLSGTFAVTSGNTYHVGVCSKNSVGGGSNNTVWGTVVIDEVVKL